MKCFSSWAGRRRFQKRLFCNWTGGYKWSTALALRYVLSLENAEEFHLSHWGCLLINSPITSALSALLCSITLGGFGADRFYLGQWREGLGKLFSFGGLGIWTLIDVLLIGVGYVGPADGSLYIWGQTSGEQTGLWPPLLHAAPVSKDGRFEILCSQHIRPPELSAPRVLIPSANKQEVFSASHQQCLFPHGQQINPSHSASISCWGCADGAVQEEEKPVIMCIQLVRFKCWLSSVLLIDSFGFLWSGALADILSPQSTHCSSFIAR